MAKSYNQKMKILYLMQYFLENTDENHVVSMKSILEMLERNGVKAERKSVYDDIEALRVFGMDILNRKVAPAGYYLASRDFELPELKLLVDAVQSSKFITTRKSNELIQKLESLASHYDAKQLQRQVYVSNRIKTMNESIYYNVDEIHAAISEQVQIRFQYYEWNVKKEMQLRKNGAFYQVSPLALSWDDENYYLVAFDEEADKLKHFRVDKMKNISVTEQRVDYKKSLPDFDAGVYAQKMFGMFGGEDTTVEILFKNKFIGVVIDRFGKDVSVKPVDEESFRARANVSVSAQFYGWLSGLGSGVKLVKPKAVVEDYRTFLKKLWKQYK